MREQREAGEPLRLGRWPLGGPDWGTLNSSQVDPQRFTGGPSTLVPTHLMRFTFGGFAGAAHESRQVRQAKRPQARRQRSVCGAMACRLSCAAASLPRVTIISLCERASAARHLGGLCRVDRAVPGARIGPEGRSLRVPIQGVVCTARPERRGATCRQSRFSQAQGPAPNCEF